MFGCHAIHGAAFLLLGQGRGDDTNKGGVWIDLILNDSCGLGDVEAFIV